MIDPNLHVIVPDTIHQQALQTEQVVGGRELQQPLEADVRVDLRRLPDETDERDVAQG